MVSNSRHGFWALVLCILTTWFGAEVHAQVYGQYLLETGAPTFVTPESVPMGFVNVANGNLHIEIPIVSTPQRGGGSYVGKFVYDSRIWKVVNTGSGNSWQPTNVPGSPGSVSSGYGWRFLAQGRLPNADSDWVLHTCEDDEEDEWIEYKNYRFYDLSGTIRRFATYYEEPEHVGCNTGVLPNTTSGPALDATGFVMELSALYSNSPYDKPERVIGPDGTMVWNRASTISGPCASCPVWMDPNGNSINRSGSSNFKDTLDRTVVTKTVINSTEWHYTVLTSKGSSTYKLFFSGSLDVDTNFGQSGVTEYDGFLSNPLQSIEFPDGSTYQFTYETGGTYRYGLLKTMTLPTGEVVTFTHATFADGQGKRNRWIDTVNKGGGTWTFARATCGSSCNKVTVTRPSGDATEYTFAVNNGAWNTESKAYTGSVASGTLELTVQNEYDTTLPHPVNGNSAFVRRTRTTTTWPGPVGNLVKKTEATYADNFTYSYQGTNYSGNRGNVRTSSEFAYGSGSPGGLVRQQVFTYLHESNPSYLTKNIVNRVTNAQTKNAAGTKLAETITTYDSTALTSVTGITHHDDANFGTGFTLRGNPTVIQTWTGSSYLSTTLTYDTTGQVVSASDPKGNVSQFSYANSFFLDNNQSPPAAYTPTPPAANAYVTGITLPLSGSVSYGYYYGSGKRAKGTGQNGEMAEWHYYDSFDRPTKTYLPGGGWNQSAYTTPTQTDYTGYTPGGTGQGQLILDSLARPKDQILVSDPQGQTLVRKTYDTSGRVQSVTNPYRTTGDPTYGTTSYMYDGLNRVKQVGLPPAPSGNSIDTFYGSGVGPAGGRTTQLCASGTYGLGYPTLSKDEGGKKRQVWVDALGRLIEADEPDATGALTLGTCYLYDVLGNLLQVDQGVQTRAMSYDALSRLVTETTPEAGSMSYFYTTSGGALCAGNPSALCRVTDARSITTTYAYDAENRLTGKTYSNGDPAVSYFYDQTSYNGLTITNGLGRRTGMSDSSGQTAWSYDSEGNMTTERRTIAGITKTLSYTYFADGSVSQITYPSGRVIKFSYSTARKTSKVECGTPTSSPPCFGSQIVQNPQYAPHGALASVLVGRRSAPIGNFREYNLTYTYNKRLQPVNMKVKHSDDTVTVMDFTYSFASGSVNDGHVKSVTNNLATGRTQTYTYDEMNRLKTAKTQATSGSNCWGQEYTYDRYANLTAMAIAATHGSCSGQTVLNLGISPTTNRITDSGVSYDAAGNLLSDGFSSYTWNAEGRMASAATAGVTYNYDGDGKRVKKSNGKLYWYGLGGEVLAETDLSGTVLVEYIYFGGTRIVRWEPPTGAVYYYLSDRLGSARMVVNSSGGVVEESDFQPYGREWAITDTINNTSKFTGHERDTESGLDHTEYRKFASTLARWLSADPARGKSGNPQTWNRYSYGASNPTNMIDAEGADACPVNPPPDSPGCIEVVAPPIPVNPFDSSIPSGLDPWGYQGGGGLFTIGGSAGNEDARDGYDNWQQGFNERQQEKLETLCSTFTNPLPSGVCPETANPADSQSPLNTGIDPLEGLVLGLGALTAPLECAVPGIAQITIGSFMIGTFVGAIGPACALGPAACVAMFVGGGVGLVGGGVVLIDGGINYIQNGYLPCAFGHDRVP